MLAISRRQNRKQQQTILSLKIALIELILEHNDIKEITVSEIASQADLNRGTFYAHFKEKDELVEALFFDAIEGVEQALRVPYQNVEKVILDGVVPSTRLIFEHIEQHKSLFKALDLIETSPGLYDRLETMMWKINTDDIQFEMETSPSEIEYDIFISYQVHAILGVIKHWIKNNFKYTADFMCEQLTAIYSNRLTAMVIKEHKKTGL